MALYGAIPVTLAHGLSPQGEPRTAGVFWHNPSEAFIDIEDVAASEGKATQWMSESGIVDLFPFSIVEPYLTVTCTFLNLRNHRRVALVSPGRLIPLGNTVWRRSLSTERPGKAARDLILSVSPRVLPHLAGLRARVS